MPMAKLQLGALFGLWHLFNTVRWKKVQVLKVFPFPMNVTTVQFAVGTAVALLMWTTGILKRPKVSGAQMAAILPLAMVWTMVNLFTNMRPGKVAVSFTHMDKPQMELISSSSFLVLLWAPGQGLGAINLFSVITVMSFFIMAPVTFVTEGVKVTPAVLQSMGLESKGIYTRLVFGA
ncbi:hypothetical protein HU200_062231 [Digitaria exilis]|uniref:Sugar phosphate transporter domain-containing protein n=1 Tax=Digitaria exilis TaxID=1010633 RepID=A0A835AAU8_9POAL|nr:hypothetical protein HU200_062231 [Digitaria exilis]